MQASPGQVTRTQDNVAAGEFFIPDLCAARPVFTMVLLVELMVLVYTLSSSSLPGFDWELLAVCSLFVQWVVLLSATLLCALRQLFSRMQLPLVTACSLLVVLAVTGLSSVVALQLLRPFFSGVAGEGWWLLRNLLVAAVLTGVMLRYFYLQQQLRLQQHLQLQARLDALRARIRPHFLFNTLNSIASLIDSRPADAERVVEDLAELMRGNLQDNQRIATVADELRICELYLGIEQLRLGERLQILWDVDPQALDKVMPSLILQPLVENAVYHGISQIPAGGTIRVAVKVGGGRISVTVENPAPQQPRRSGGHHIALENISQRLQALYGSEGRLEVSRPDGGYRIELVYPQEDPA